MTTAGAAVGRVAFQPMTETDLPTVRGWLDGPHVQPWWRPEDYEEVRRAVAGEEPIEPWILVVDGRDAGYFQLYDVGSDADYVALCEQHGIGAGTADIDYLIGEPDLIGRGVGTAAIARFVDDVVFARGDWPAVIACPSPANTASLRVLEKNGFAPVAVIDTTDGPEQIMRRARLRG